MMKYLSYKMKTKVVKEHVYRNNIILEHKDGTFTATKFYRNNPDNDVLTKDCKSLAEAKAFICGETYPRRPKFTRESTLHNKDGYAIETLRDKGKRAYCVLTEYGIFIVYDTQWESFVKAPKDFNAKSVVSYKGFNDLKKWDRYSKTQIS